MSGGNIAVSTPPAMGGLQANKVYEEDALREFASDDQERKFQRWTKWGTVPDKYEEGDQYYFLADVVGLVAGLYYWNGTKWVFCGDYPAGRGALYSGSTQVGFAVGTADTLVDNYLQDSATPVDTTQNAAAGTITVNRDGIYLAQAFVDFLNPAPNLTWSIVFYRNGAAAELTRARTTAKDNNDGVNIQTIIISPLNVGDVIDVRVNCSSPQTISTLSKLFSLVQQQ